MLISEFQQKPAAKLYDLCDAYRLWDVTFAPSASKIARGVAIRRYCKQTATDDKNQVSICT